MSPSANQAPGVLLIVIQTRLSTGKGCLGRDWQIRSGCGSCAIPLPFLPSGNSEKDPSSQPNVICKMLTISQAVFKYYFHIQYAARSWSEMNIWIRLPRHPNIVPFDRVITDKLEGRVIGFTNNYISGVLWRRRNLGYSKKWLQQLTNLADD